MSLKEKAEALRRELSQIIIGYADSPQKLPVFFPPELVERAVQYVKQAAQQGISVPQCSDELNISQARLHYWLYTRKKNVRPPLPSRRRSNPSFRPVHVSAERVPIYDGVPVNQGALIHYDVGYAQQCSVENYIGCMVQALC